MEIKKQVEKGKITMIIKDYISTFDYENVVNIKDLIDNNLNKTKIILIDDIDSIIFYELRVVDVINKFAFKYNVKGTKFINQILKLSTLSSDYLEKDPMFLNDSEKFKLILALVLMLNPTTIIINNLSCYLDNKSRDDVLFTLKRLKREHNKTIIINDNDVDYCYSVSDNVIVIKNNEIILEGKKDKLYYNINMLKKKNIPIPIYVEFIDYVKSNKGNDIDVLVRDDVKDIMKDIYRSLSW